MLAVDAHIMAVDFESTGVVSGYPDEPWQIGIVPIMGGKPVMEQAYETFIRVSADRPFNPCAPGSWKLVREQLAEAKPLPKELVTPPVKKINFLLAFATEHSFYFRDIGR